MTPLSFVIETVMEMTISSWHRHHRSSSKLHPKSFVHTDPVIRKRINGSKAYVEIVVAVAAVVVGTVQGGGGAESHGRAEAAAVVVAVAAKV